MEKPKHLYKYVVPDRIDILKNGLIRFTQPSALNDPFELQPIFDELIPESLVKEAIDPPFECVEDALRRDYENLTISEKTQFPIETVISFVKQNPGLLKSIMDRIEPDFRSALSTFAPKAKKMLAEALNAKVGILSLSETINNPLLWAHYADSHKGFVIKFNTENSFFNRRRFDKDELLYLRKVKYKNRTSEGRTLMDLNGDDLLTTKKECWEYEAEWRMLAPLEKADNIIKFESEHIFLFELPLIAVSEIILGSRVSHSLYGEIKSYVASINTHQILLKKAVLNIENQKIEIIDLARVGPISGA